MPLVKFESVPHWTMSWNYVPSMSVLRALFLSEGISTGITKLANSRERTIMKRVSLASPWSLTSGLTMPSPSHMMASARL